MVRAPLAQADVRMSRARRRSCRLRQEFLQLPDAATATADNTPCKKGNGPQNVRGPRSPAPPVVAGDAPSRGFPRPCTCLHLGDATGKTAPRAWRVGDAIGVARCWPYERMQRRSDVVSVVARRRDHRGCERMVRGWCVDAKFVHHVCWAEDTCVFAASPEHLPQMLEELENAAAKWGARGKRQFSPLTRGDPAWKRRNDVHAYTRPPPTTRCVCRAPRFSPRATGRRRWI